MQLLVSKSPVTSGLFSFSWVLWEKTSNHHNCTLNSVADQRELECSHIEMSQELYFSIYLYQHIIPLLKCLYAADQECFCSGHVNKCTYHLFCSK